MKCKDVYLSMLNNNYVCLSIREITTFSWAQHQIKFIRTHKLLNLKEK